MNSESNPSASPSNNHPALALASRIDMFDAKLRLMELYVTEARTAAAAESKRSREQFQADLSVLQNEVKQKEAALETHQALAQQADRNQRKQIQELRGELLDANRLAESRQSELTANKLAATALRERIKFLEGEAEKNQTESTRQMASLFDHIKQLESANQHAESRIAKEFDSKFAAELTALRQQLADKDAEIRSFESRERDHAARYESETRALQSDVAAAKSLLEENGRALAEAKAENRRLRDHVAAANAVREQALADAQRASDARSEEYRQQIAALEQRDGNSTALLQQHTSEIARLQLLQATLQCAAEEHKQQAAEAHAKVVQLVNAQQALEAELAEARRDQQQREQIEQQLHSVVEQLAEKQRSIDCQTREFDALQNLTSQLRSQIAQLEEAKWLAGEEYSRNLGELNQELQRLASRLHDNEQQLAAREQDYAALQQHSGQLREQLTHQEQLHQQQIQEHAAATEALQQELRQVSDELTASREDVEARERELLEFQEDKRRLGEQITALEFQGRQAGEAHTAQIQNLEWQLVDLRHQVGEKQQNIERREGELNDLQNNARELHQQLAELHQARDQAAAEHQTTVTVWREQQLQLQAQLSEKQQLMEAREREIADLHESARQLHDRLLEQEQIHRQAAAEQVSKIQDLEVSISARALELESARVESSARLAQRDAELQTLQGQTAELEECAKQLQSALEQSNGEKREIDQQRGALQRRWDDLQRAFEETQATLLEQRSECGSLHDRLEAERHNLTQRSTDWEQRFQIKESDLQRAYREIDELNGELQTLHASHLEQLQSSARELENARERFHAELVALRDELQVKEAALHNRRAELVASETRLNGTVQELTTELAHEQYTRQRKEQELARVSAEVSALQDRVTELETLSTETEHTLAAKIDQLNSLHSNELTALQARLQDREQALAAQAVDGLANQERLLAELAALQQSYAEKQGLIEQRELNIASLQRESRELTAQLQEAQARYDQAFQASRVETEQRFTTELAVRQVAILQLQNELADNQRETSDLEQSLTGQVNALQRQLDENAALLSQRAATLESVHSEIYALRDRIGALQRTNADLVNDGRKLDEEFQLRLAALESAAADRTALLEQRGAELEKAYAEISALRQHILSIEAIYQRSQTEEQSARAMLQDDLTHARHALEWRTQDFAAETASLRAAREQVAAELTTLQAQLAEREGRLDARERDCAALRGDIASLTAQLTASLTAAEHSSEASRTAAERAERDAAEQIAAKEALLREALAAQQAQQNELAGLREQAAHVEQLRRRAERADADDQRAEQASAELVALRAELADRERALAAHEERSRSLENTYRESLSQLQLQLANHQLLAESRARQTEDLRAQIEVLREQLVVLESNSREFAQRQQEESARAATELKADIDALHNQIAEHRAIIEARDMEMGALQNEKTELQSEIERLRASSPRLSSASVAGHSATYGDQLIEIANLRAEIVEKQQLLEDRNEKLLYAKGELADLQKSLEHIAKTKAEAHAVPIAATDNDLLWEQLGQNDRPSEHVEPAVVNDRDTGFRVTFDRRQNDSVPLQRATAPAQAERLPSNAEVSVASEDAHEELEFLVRTGNSEGRPMPNNGHDRRWRFSLGRKRRWKS